MRPENATSMWRDWTLSTSKEAGELNTIDYKFDTFYLILLVPTYSTLFHPFRAFRLFLAASITPASCAYRPPPHSLVRPHPPVPVFLPTFIVAPALATSIIFLELNAVIPRPPPTFVTTLLFLWLWFLSLLLLRSLHPINVATSTTIITAIIRGLSLPPPLLLRRLLRLPLCLPGLRLRWLLCTP